MTYHRTGGKGGTRNTSRDEPFPNFNKNTVTGNKAAPKVGRRRPNNMSTPAAARRPRSGNGS